MIRYVGRGEAQSGMIGLRMEGYYTSEYLPPAKVPKNRESNLVERFRLMEASKIPLSLKNITSVVK